MPKLEITLILNSNNPLTSASFMCHQSNELSSDEAEKQAKTIRTRKTSQNHMNLAQMKQMKQIEDCHNIVKQYDNIWCIDP